MDHLLCPPNPKHERIEVPYLASAAYDGGPLESYPERKGWPDPSDPSSTLGFIQTWLYFGLLHAIFADRVEHHMFISLKSNPSRAVVDTSPLPALSEGWIESQRALDSATRKQMRMQARNTVTFVARCLEGIYYVADKPYGLSLIFSIEMLCEFLQSASLRAYDTSPEFDWRHHGADEVNWTNHHEFHSKSLVHIRLLEDGWCPNEVASFSLQFPGSGLYYISNFERPGASKDHSKCSEFKCSAYQLGNSEYRSQHTCEDCACTYVYDEGDRVRQTLLGGSFPVISYLAMDGQETLNVVEAHPNLEYVAISHVWSDGLGNLKHNALLKCQLRRLSQLASRALQFVGIRGIPFFWVDTVCCPPEAGEAQDLAISRMRATYERAACVLVLDSWLQQQSKKGHSDADILMRIACSGWNRRLWTYQEGSLAKRLLFWFNDGIFDFDRTPTGLYEDRDTAYSLTLQTSVAKQVFGTRGLRMAAKLSNTLRIKSIMLSLKFRSTSVASDEALCLGTMLNVDVGNILKASDTAAGRMAELWRSLPEVPADLLLFGGRRLQEKSLCWAPASLLSSRNPGWAGILKYSDERAAKVDGDGIHVQFPGFVIPAAHGGTIFRKFYFPLAGTTKYWFEVCCYRTLASEDALKREAEGHGSSVDGSVVVRPTSVSEPDVALALVSQVAVFRPEVPVEVRSAGILAACTQIGDDLVKARYLCDVTVQYKATDDGSASFEEWITKMRGTETVVQGDTQIWELSDAKAYAHQTWYIA